MNNLNESKKPACLLVEESKEECKYNDGNISPANQNI